MEWLILFQSPRSGQICSNITAKSGLEVVTDVFEFQSPRSGQICSNDEAADDTIRFDD